MFSLPSAFLFLVTLSATSYAKTDLGALSRIQHWKIGQYAQVYFVPTHEVPMVDMHVLSPVGTANDAQSPGLAKLTSQLLLKNVHHGDDDVITHAFYKHGAHYGVVVSQRHTDIEVMTPSAVPHAMANAKTLARALTFAEFKPEKVKQHQSMMQTSLLIANQRASYVAISRFFEELYGRYSPYGHRPLGNPTSIAAIDHGQIKKYYQRYFIKQPVTIILVGDINTKQAHTIGEILSKPFQAASTQKASHTWQHMQDHMPSQSKYIHINLPVSQSALVMGTKSFAMKDPNYYPFLVGQMAFGGGDGLSSYIAKIIRENKGLTYGIYAYSGMIDALKGHFVIQVTTQNKNVAQVIHLINQARATFVKKGLKPSILRRTKNQLQGRLLMKSASNAGLAQCIINLAKYNLPLNHYQQWLNHIEHVTIEQVQMAFDQLNRQPFITIVGGHQINQDKY